MAISASLRDKDCHMSLVSSSFRVRRKVIETGKIETTFFEPCSCIFNLPTNHDSGPKNVSNFSLRDQLTMLPRWFSVNSTLSFRTSSLPSSYLLLSHATCFMSNLLPQYISRLVSCPERAILTSKSRSGDWHCVYSSLQFALQWSLALLAVKHYLCSKYGSLHPLSLDISNSLCAISTELDRHAPSPSAITLSRYFPHGPRYDCEHDRFCMRSIVEKLDHNRRMGLMVDRRRHLRGHLLLPPLRDHVQPCHRTEEHDSHLATARCRHYRCCSLWWHRRGHPA